MVKKISLLIYYLIIKNLPHSRYYKGFNGIRVWYMKRVLKIHSGGQNSFFENGVYIGSAEGISIGENTQINENVFLQKVQIGKNCLIAPNAVILSESHEYSSTTEPIRTQGNKPSRKVIIHENTWIGRSTIILPGIQIGANSIIGAGSIVTKDIPSNSIAAGNPCRVIKQR